MLKVRSANGSDFHRCGIKFGKEPVIVEDETLAKVFIKSRKKDAARTVEQVLRAEPMLVCEAYTPPKDEAKK